ncbi:MAG TPA: hypothetical protein VKH45_05455 [Candidatus Acidoferrum sp.]|nr:hypothetical protein [Candidatus Acidoferrum sp.]
MQDHQFLQSSSLFRTAADLVEESSVAAFIVKPYILAGAVTELVAKIKAGKTTYVLGEIVRLALDKVCASLNRKHGNG